MDCQMKPANDNLFLFCADDSKHSLHAFHWYYKHIYRQEHTFGLVHIYTLPETIKFSKSHHSDMVNLENLEYEKDVEEARQRRAATVNRYRELCEERKIELNLFCVPKSESIGHMICDIAQQNNAACIVMGQRGLGAIKRTMFGSVSDYVLHHANVTVVIVPPEKEDK